MYLLIVQFEKNYDSVNDTFYFMNTFTKIMYIKKYLIYSHKNLDTLYIHRKTIYIYS